jgi:hypothetical protein
MFSKTSTNTAMPFNVTFISQREPYGNRYSNFGCGAACLLMLLRHRYIDRSFPDYESLCKQLRIEMLPSEKGYPYSDDLGPGAYPEDIRDWLSAGGIAFTAATDQDSETPRGILDQLSREPVMVGIDDGLTGHWIVFVKKCAQSVMYFDPFRLSTESYRRYFRLNTFREIWDGHAFWLD